MYNEDTVSEDMLEFLQAFLEGTHLDMLYHQSTLNTMYLHLHIKCSTEELGGQRPEANTGQNKHTE